MVTISNICHMVVIVRCSLYYVQGSPKRLALGCVNPASRLPLAAGGEFTQPRAHLLADPCTIYGIGAAVINATR